MKESYTPGRTRALCAGAQRCDTGDQLLLSRRHVAINQYCEAVGLFLPQHVFYFELPHIICKAVPKGIYF